MQAFIFFLAVTFMVATSTQHSLRRRLQQSPDGFVCSFDATTQLIMCRGDSVFDEDGANVTVDSKVTCRSPDGSFDFREAPACTCISAVTRNGQTKPCECSVCPTSFGLSPISINCDYAERPSFLDPFLYPFCKSNDCQGTCDGDCTVEACKNRDCSHCEVGSPSSAPTSSPASPTSAPISSPTVSPSSPTASPVKLPNPFLSASPVESPTASPDPYPGNNLGTVLGSQGSIETPLFPERKNAYDSKDSTKLGSNAREKPLHRMIRG